MNLQYQKSGKIIIVLCALFNYITFLAQNLEYIGLNGISNVRTAQAHLTTAGIYWPKTQVIDSFMYVPTSNGIYRKNLNTVVNDTLWQHYAFHGQPIRDFLKKNDSLIGLTAITQEDSLMLLSVNNGMSYIDHTDSYFFDYYNLNTIRRISKHPIEPETFIVMHDGFGIARTTDFGNTWTTLNQWLGGMQDRSASYHPLDGNSMFYTGEQLFEESYILNSYDNGQTWTFSENIPSHCTHLIAFHPTDPNILISGGEGRIAKSIDKGQTWINKGTPGVYVYKILYDENNPEILYASGDHNSPIETVEIYNSVDGGENWSLFYSEDIPDSDGIMDIHLYDNYLYVYTLTNGAFRLDLEALNVSEEQLANTIKITPNPSENYFSLNTNLQIESIKLYNISGSEIKNYNSINDKHDVSELSTGIYFVKVVTEIGSMIKKLVKK